MWKGGRLPIVTLTLNPTLIWGWGYIARQPATLVQPDSVGGGTSAKVCWVYRT